MPDKLNVAPYIYDIVDKLQNAGFETYIVGGAIRDLMLNRTPKDYDISSAATPEEVRSVFGRRRARIIGRRFRLVHLRAAGELIEISTFRRPPDNSTRTQKRLVTTPQNMIFRDNDFGTSSEDAWRRDFSVNALFYNPVNNDLIDFTGYGIEDMHNGIVRAIGDPALRFEEDPVRLLRALKLVGQYEFSLEDKTAKALRQNLELIVHASSSRMALELEKILKNPYCPDIFGAFKQHDFLKYFLPFFDNRWETPPMRYAIEIMHERKRRIQQKLYRDSISLAMGALLLPFIEGELGHGNSGKLWEYTEDSCVGIQELLREAFKPHNLIKRLQFSAQRLLKMQPLFHLQQPPRELIHAHGYAHARELMLIQNELVWHQADAVSRWPEIIHKSHYRHPKKRSRRRRKN